VRFEESREGAESWIDGPFREEQSRQREQLELMSFWIRVPDMFEDTETSLAGAK
jgi:hypothetical protein